MESPSKFSWIQFMAGIMMIVSIAFLIALVAAKPPDTIINATLTEYQELKSPEDVSNTTEKAKVIPEDKLELDANLPVDQMIISFLQQIEPMRKKIIATDPRGHSPEMDQLISGIIGDANSRQRPEGKFPFRPHVSNPEFDSPLPTNRQVDVGPQTPNKEYNFYPPYYAQQSTPSAGPISQPITNNVGPPASEWMFQPMYNRQYMSVLRSGYLSDPAYYPAAGRSRYPNPTQSYDYGYGVPRDYYYNNYPDNEEGTPDNDFDNMNGPTYFRDGPNQDEYQRFETGHPRVDDSEFQEANFEDVTHNGRYEEDLDRVELENSEEPDHVHDDETPNPYPRLSPNQDITIHVDDDSSSYNLPLPPPVINSNAQPGRYIFKYNLPRRNYQMMDQAFQGPHRFQPPGIRHQFPTYPGSGQLSLRDLFFGLPQITVSIAASKAKMSNSTTKQQDIPDEYMATKTPESNLIDVDGKETMKKDLKEDESDEEEQKVIIGIDRRRRSAQFYGIPLNEDTVYASQVQLGAALHTIKPQNFMFRPDGFTPAYLARHRSVDPKQGVFKAEEQNDSNFPRLAPGATVAQNPLPETVYPVFPYNPEQDEPGAIIF